MVQNFMQLSGVDLVVPTHGLEGVKAYPLGVNCRVPLFDDSKDVFYIKSTDENGFPSVRTFGYSEIVTETESKSVTLDDIRSIIKEELANAKQPISTTSSKQSKSNVTSHASAVKRNAATSAAAGTAIGTTEQGTDTTVVENS